MPVLHGKQEGIVALQYSTTSLSLGLVGALAKETTTVNPSFISPVLLGIIIGCAALFVYRAATKQYPLKKEISAALFPLLFSPVIAGMIGVYAYYTPPEKKEEHLNYLKAGIVLFALVMMTLMILVYLLTT